ncbi:ATP-binding protein [Streptomyces virginiae]|uniref:ATP-binding protein n=1 Tax=Streptomyces virginiae TaxID=1961 RepID=UPI003324F559
MNRVDPESRDATIELPFSSTCATLRAEPESVPAARALVKQLLRTCGVAPTDDAVDAAFLVVTELFTNAVVHSDATKILLSLSIMDGNLLVGVTENGVLHREIHERPVSDLDESGRGLLLVRELSRDWGKSTSYLGTNVWAVLPLTCRAQPSSSSNLIGLTGG